MIQNMRDLGGIRTTDGRTVRKGMLVRAAQPGQAEEKDFEGISTVIDLRTTRERGEKPDRVFGREYLTLPVFDDVKEGISHEKETRDRGIPDMEYLYGEIIRDYAGSFRRILLAIMDHDYGTGAILWHCTEGKDRCGMTAALVLEALGASRETILEDYMKTNDVNMPKAIAVRDGLIAKYGPEAAETAEKAYMAYIADERYMRAAWEAMGTGYIREKLGIGEETLEEFRNRILE